MILIIDNYDSFTYNLYQALAVITPEIKVIRNDAISLADIEQLKPAGIVLSPGPSHPNQAGICIEVVRNFGQTIPILGVCLGHQAIGVAFGGTVNRATQQLHGQQTALFHNRSALFQGISLPFTAGRYHSLIVESLDFPNALKIDATDAAGNIMALSHRTYPIFGVQFHPESILTPEGNQILKNFLRICHVA